MSPLRVDLTMRLAERARRRSASGCAWCPRRWPTDDLIATVHTTGADRGRRPGRRDPGASTPTHGLGTDDNPVFPDMHHAAAHVVGATVEAFRQVWSGRVAAHAPTSPAACTTRCPTGPAASASTTTSRSASSSLLDQGAERVAYVDVDVHHGDGVERIFWDDPRVLTDLAARDRPDAVPRHRLPAATSAARTPQGTAVNVALPPGTGDAGWLRAFHAVVPPLLREFAPGRPGHPARLRLPHRGPARPPDADRRRPAGGVPRPARPRPRGRATAAGSPPAAAATRWSTSCRGPGRTCWRSSPAARSTPRTTTPRGAGASTSATALGRTAPHRLTDGRTPAYRDWSEGYDPDTWLDRAIHATRTEVFPLHGLDPLP